MSLTKKPSLNIILGSVAAAFTIIGSLYITYDALATEEEVAKVKTEILNKHNTDRVTDAQLRKNYRIDQIDSDLYFINESILFGNLTPEQKAFKEERKRELKLKRQNILEDKE